MFSHDPSNKEWKHKESLARAYYIHILSLVIDIIKQQSKVEWIGYGDECTKYFFAKIKQMKIATYILIIQDDQGHTKQGFSEVTEVMHKFYKSLLGVKYTERQKLDPTVIRMGSTLTVVQQKKLCAPLTDQDIKNVMFSIPNIVTPQKVHDSLLA